MSHSEFWTVSDIPKIALFFAFSVHFILLLCRSHVSSAHFWPQNMLLGHFAQERICNLAKLISSPTSPPHFYSFLVQTTLWAHFCSREKRSTQLLLPQWAENVQKSANWITLKPWFNKQDCQTFLFTISNNSLYPM